MFGVLGVSLFNEKEKLEDNQGLQKFNIDYKTLMQMIVCDIECLECMVHRCEKCPGYNNLESITGKSSSQVNLLNLILMMI